MSGFKRIVTKGDVIYLPCDLACNKQHWSLYIYEHTEEERKGEIEGNEEKEGGVSYVKNEKKETDDKNENVQNENEQLTQNIKII